MTDGGYTMAEAWNLQLQAKVTRLEAENARLREALSVCRAAIVSPLNKRSVVDTIWASEIETLVDAIDAALKGAVTP